MRSEFGARYVRMYGSCDYDDGFFDRFVTTAFQQGLGVYSTIWMDFDGSDSWRGRRERILNVIQNNPYAPYVVRSVDLGSEALFFHLLDAGSMANEINYIKSVVGRFGIKVSTSEIVYAYSQIDNAQTVLDAEEVLHAHPLPYFDPNVTYGSGARNSVFDPADWLVQHTGGSKKIIFTQTGWPTRYNAALPGGNPATVASADSAQAYAQLLDASCEDLKSRTPQGGVGYFWHSFNENAMDGWGVLDENGNTKYNFHPRTSC
ncbi:hypothetical protein CPB86DRAFT_788842 [Serendipita vermifera]|nr:hypothetical protein CPB86DRAFT_788842 [Serendipita vermifera]